MSKSSGLIPITKPSSATLNNNNTQLDNSFDEPDLDGIDPFEKYIEEPKIANNISSNNTTTLYNPKENKRVNKPIELDLFNDSDEEDYRPMNKNKINLPKPIIKTNGTANSKDNKIDQLDSLINTTTPKTKITFNIDNNNKPLESKIEKEKPLIKSISSTSLIEDKNEIDKKLSTKELYAQQKLQRKLKAETAANEVPVVTKPQSNTEDDASVDFGEVDLPIEASKIKTNPYYFEATENQKRELWSKWLIGNNGDDKKFIDFNSIEFMHYLENGIRAPLDYKNYKYDSKNNSWRIPNGSSTKIHPMVNELNSKISQRCHFIRIGKPLDYNSGPDDENSDLNNINLVNVKNLENKPVRNLESPTISKKPDNKQILATTPQFTPLASVEKSTKQFDELIAVNNVSNNVHNLQISQLQSELMSLESSLSNQRKRYEDLMNIHTSCQDQLRNIEIELKNEKTEKLRLTREFDNSTSLLRNQLTNKERAYSDLVSEMSELKHHNELKLKAVRLELDQDKTRSLGSQESFLREEFNHTISLLKSEIDDTKRRHLLEMESLKKLNEESLVSLRRQQSDSVYLSALAKTVNDSASSLNALHAVVSKDKLVGDKELELAFEARDQILKQREKELRQMQIELNEREFRNSKLISSFESEKSTFTIEMKRMAAQQSEAMQESAAWRDTLNNDRNKIQSEWAEINTAKHAWEIQRSTQMREFERTKSEVLRRLEDANQREIESTKFFHENQRRIEDDLARFASEAKQFSALKMELEKQRTSLISQQEWVKQQELVFQEKMQELTHIAQTVSEKSDLVMKESVVLTEHQVKLQNEKQSLVEYEAILRKREQQINELNSMVNRDKLDMEKDRVETLIAKRTLGAYENELETKVNVFERRLNKQKLNPGNILDPTNKLLELLGSVQEKREKNRVDELFKREILVDKINTSYNSNLERSYYQKPISDSQITKTVNYSASTIKPSFASSVPVAKQNINNISLDHADKFFENRKLLAKESKFKQYIDDATKDIGHTKKFLEEIDCKYSDEKLFINIPETDLSFAVSSNFNSDPSSKSRRNDSGIFSINLSTLE